MRKASLESLAPLFTVVGRRQFIWSALAGLMCLHGHELLSQSGLEIEALKIYKEAAAAQKAAQNDRAFELFSKALALFRKTRDRKFQAYCLTNLGIIENRRNKPAEAIVPLTEALTIWRDFNDRLFLRMTFVERAASQEKLHNLQEAIKDFESAIPFLDGAYKIDVLSMLGIHLNEIGRRRDAIDRLIEAANLAKAAQARAEEATASQVAGLLLVLEEQYPAAINWLERTAQLTHEDNDPALEAATLEALGVVYLDVGRPADSRRALSEALAIAKRSFNREEAASAAAFIAEYYGRLGDYREASKHWNDAVALVESTTNRRLLARMCLGQARSIRYQGYPKDAEKILARAVTLAMSVNDRDLEGHLRVEQGQLLVGLGETTNALVLFAKAADIFRDSHLILGEVQAYLATASVYKKDFERGKARSVAEFEPIEHRMNELLKSLLRSPSPELGATTLAVAYLTLAGVQIQLGQRELALDNSDKARAVFERLGVPEEAFALSEIGRLQENENPRAARYAYRRAITLAEKVWNAAKISELQSEFAGSYAEIYQRAAAFFAASGSTAEAFMVSEQARARSILADLATRLKSSPSQASDPTGALSAMLGRATQRAYDEDRLRMKLVNGARGEFTPISLDQTQTQLDESTTLVSYLVGPEKVIAFRITKSEAEAVELAVSTMDLNKLLASVHMDATTTQLETQLKQLSRWLIAPLEPKLKTARIGVVPHRSLHKISFAALQCQDGEYLGDRFALFYLPSVSMLQLERRPLEGAARMLATSCVQTRVNQLPRLEFAEAEARDVARLFKTRLLSNPSKAEIERRLPQANLAIFAMHAESNRMLLESETIETNDIYGWDLRGFDLVMLSACRSAASTSTSADEQDDLMRAFLVAGSRSVVASLWPLDDASAARIVNAFFTYLTKDGFPKEEALQRAQRDERKLNSEVMKWAPFIFVGLPGKSIAAQS